VAWLTIVRSLAGGGNTDEGSISCSGGARSDECFSSRFMWRTPTNGVAAGELYTYLPTSFKANEKLCTVPPYSDCNPVYGASVGRGAYQIPTGKWVTLAQRVRLNDVNEANGQIQVFVDGKSVISVNGLVLRNSDAGKIRGVFGQTFFGGALWQLPTSVVLSLLTSVFSQDRSPSGRAQRTRTRTLPTSPSPSRKSSKLGPSPDSRQRRRSHTLPHRHPHPRISSHYLSLAFLSFLS
jgi:hypothetical protein